MKLTSSKFELLCIALLGLGHMFIFIGYNAQTFLVESVLHSVNSREPERIDAHGGYNGQAITYMGYMLSCLITPSLLPYLSAKWSVFIGSIGFTIYYAGFFYLNNYFYYFTSAVMGAGFAFFYTGYATYLTAHSSKSTLEQNSSITWSICNLSLLVGGAVILVVFHLSDVTAFELAGNSTATDQLASNSREFSDDTIFWMYATFTTLSLIANLIFASMSARDIDGCIEGGRPKCTLSFRKQMYAMFAAFVDPNIILLVPLFINIGITTAFWIAVYPTTFIFTESLSVYKYLPAYYSIWLGIGELIMGAVIAGGSRVIRNFGMLPTMCIASVSTIVIVAALVVSVPEWSTIRPTNEPTLLFKPSIFLTLIAAFTFGLIDSGTNTARNVACALAMPHARPQAFAISKIFQAGAGAVSMVLSSHMSIYHHAVLLIVTITTSTFTIGVIQRRIESNTNK